MKPEPPGAASFCLELELTQVGRSRSRLQDIGHQEPESAPGPWPSGARAAQKSGGSATLVFIYFTLLSTVPVLLCEP